MKVRYVVETYGGNPHEVFRADTRARCVGWLVKELGNTPRIRLREFVIRTIYTNEEEKS